MLEQVRLPVGDALLEAHCLFVHAGEHRLGVLSLPSSLPFGGQPDPATLHTSRPAKLRSLTTSRVVTKSST